MLKTNCWALGMTAILSLSIGSGAIAQEETAKSSAQTKHQSKDDINRELLEQEVTFNYNETPFIDIVEELITHYRLEVVLDASASEDSLTLDELVTFNIKGVPLGSALQLLLSNFNATYIARDEVVRIISKDVAGYPEYFVQKIINCRDVLEKLRRERSVAPDSISSVQRVLSADDASAGNVLGATRGGGGGFGGGRRAQNAGGGGVFQLAPGSQLPTEKNSPKQKEAAKQSKDSNATKTWYLVKRGEFNPEAELINLIKMTVVPDDWDDTNGDGTAMIVGGCLIIKQTEAANREIENLLDQLSAALDRE